MVGMEGIEPPGQGFQSPARPSTSRWTVVESNHFLAGFGRALNDHTSSLSLIYRTMFTSFCPMANWDNLPTIVAQNATFSGMLRQLGLTMSPGNWYQLKGKIKERGLDTSHVLGKAHGTSISPKKRSLASLLRKESRIGSSALRKKLLQANVLENKCNVCGLGPIWNDQPLTLQLDHKNGDPFDNRLENLRIICPNCHTQTATFTGKNISRRYRAPGCAALCRTCGSSVSRGFNRCSSCFGKEKEKRTAWPSAQVVKQQVLRTSYLEVAQQLGVSDNAVRKFLRRHLGEAPRKRALPAGFDPASSG